MIPVGCRSLQLVVGELGWIVLVLCQPPYPEVVYTLLVATAPYNNDGMQIDSLFYGVDRLSV